MIKIRSLFNQLLSSICYIIYDDVSKRCVIIDPGSEKSLNEIDFIEQNGLKLDYVIMTHEHVDHCWGVNALRNQYPDLKLVYSEACNKYLQKSSRIFFQMYFDDAEYEYVIKPAEIQIKESGEILDWNGQQFRFILTPGHSLGSMCIAFGDSLFTGDTIIPFPPSFSGFGRNKADWKDSISYVLTMFPSNTVIYPGHGAVLTMRDWSDAYYMSRQDE